MNELARLVDAATPPSSSVEGFVAERHPSFPDTILVWAPCNCVWIKGPNEAPFVTYCRKEDCRFEWRGVDEAIKLLMHAEELAKTRGSSDANDISRASGNCCVLDDGSEAGTGPSEPSTTAQDDAQKLLEPLPKTEETPEALDMISEGGPAGPTEPPRFGDD